MIQHKQNNNEYIEKQCVPHDTTKKEKGMASRKKNQKRNCHMKIKGA